MNTKLIQVKYLAVVLLGLVFLILASVDAFSQTQLHNGVSTSLSIND